MEARIGMEGCVSIAACPHTGISIRGGHAVDARGRTAAAGKRTLGPEAGSGRRPHRGPGGETRAAAHAGTAAEMRSAATTDMDAAATATSEMTASAADMSATPATASAGVRCAAAAATSTLRTRVSAGGQDGHNNENDESFECRHGNFNRLARELQAQLHRHHKAVTRARFPGSRPGRCRWRDLRRQAPAVPCLPARLPILDQGLRVTRRPLKTPFSAPPPRSPSLPRRSWACAARHKPGPRSARRRRKGRTR